MGLLLACNCVSRSCSVDTTIYINNFDDCQPTNRKESLVRALFSLNWEWSSGSNTMSLQLLMYYLCSSSGVTCLGSAMMMSVLGELAYKDWDPIQVILSSTGEYLFIDRQSSICQKQQDNAECSLRFRHIFLVHKFYNQVLALHNYKLLTQHSGKMISVFPQPNFAQPNYNIFEIINFKFYEALPRWRKQDPDPMFMTNLYRRFSDVAWHSRFRTVYPHSLQYRALRAITVENIDELVKVLKNPAFDINGEIDRKYKLTPLQFAVMKNKFPIIELLLMYGANINKPDTQGNTPLMMAVSNHSLEAINSLLKNGCDRRLANQYGTTPVQKAIDQQAQYIADFIENYPETPRKFPKFKVKLDIEKYIDTPISKFLNQYQIFSNKPVKSPFNNFKGDYKIILNNFKTIGELIKQSQKTAQKQKQK